MRSFDKALAEFDKAAALSKDNPSIEFNIGEVYFVTKQWQKSLDIFEKVMKLLPPRTSLSDAWWSSRSCSARRSSARTTR